MSRIRRAAAAMVGILALGLVASGCSIISGISEGAAPTVGNCWVGTLTTVQKSENWGGSAAVACTSTHELYTYAVATITKKFTGSWITSSGTVNQDVDDAAYAACYSKQVSVFGTIDPDGRLLPSYFLPSVKQWESGARWVRCDIGLIKAGSLIAKPRFAALPSFASILSTLKSNPKKFALCEDDQDLNNPDGVGTTYADCTGPTDWTLEGELTMKEALGAAYPGSAALKKQASALCSTFDSPKGHELFAEPPTEDAWNDGGRELDCWVNNN